MTAKPKHRILFKGYYNVHNLGDDLLFLALLDFFQNHMQWRNKDITLFVEPGEDSLQKLGYTHPYMLLSYQDPIKAQHAQLKKNIKIGLFIKLFMGCLMLGNLISALLYRITKLQIGNAKNFLFFRNLDIVHYIGGGYFNTRLPWGMQLLVYESYFLIIGKLINPELQIIGTGLGIGPITHNFYKVLFKNFIKQFNFIFVREKESEAFVQSLGTAKHVQCIGDDVTLLLPYFQNIAQKTRKQPQFGLNLKFDNVHQYGTSQMFFENLIQDCAKSGQQVVFFNFGRDHEALKQLPIELTQKLPVYSCYETGLSYFVERLSESQKGAGFAYHFAILCALMAIPSANIYFDDYYRQKTGGVIKLLCNQHVTFDYQQLNKISPQQLLHELDLVDQDNASEIFNRLKTHYQQAYHILEALRN